MTEPRLFTEAQRRALYLLAGGRCQMCGAELNNRFHADHVIAWSRGGATDVTNGQALCAGCNRTKGAGDVPFTDEEIAMPKLNPYAWQDAARRKFHTALAEGRTDLLFAITPAGGKTRFTCDTIAPMVAAGVFTLVIVVVPTTALRGQWGTQAHHSGASLDSNFSCCVVTKDFVGIVVTYQAVANNPQFYRALTARHRTVVIFDEIHHAADQGSWGPALLEAFEPAVARILLTGTPFRTDKNPIPFVTYNGTDLNPPGFCDRIYNFTYTDALRAGCVRAVTFLSVDGPVTWAGLAQTMADVTDDQFSRVHMAATAPGGEFCESLLMPFRDDVYLRRAATPNAAGLVIARDMAHAKQLKAALDGMTRRGEQAELVLSDDPGAQKAIDRFRAGTAPFIIAVGMVAEGVDIPRLMTLAYMSNVRTELFWRQAVGRILRGAGTAKVFLPALPQFAPLALDMEAEVAAAFELEDTEPREMGERSDQTFAFDVQVGAGTVGSVIGFGQHYTVEQLEMAERVNDMALAQFGEGLAFDVLLRAIATPTPIASTPPPVISETTVQIRARKKAELNALIGKTARGNADYIKEIQVDLIRKTGKPVKDRDIAELDQCIAYVSGLL